MDDAFDRPDDRDALARLADGLGLGAGCLEPASVRLRAITRGGPGDPPSIVALLAALGGGACDARDHDDELRVARARLEATDEVGAADRMQAHLAALAAAGHVARTAPDRNAALGEVRAMAIGAWADLRERLDAEGVPPSAVRAALDPIAAVLLDAEDELRLAPSPPAADLERRRRARTVRPGAATTFGERHREGIEAVWARDAKAWHADRFADRHETPPPSGWWVDDPGAVTGGRIAEEHRDLFDAADQAAFVEEMEARYRADHGLPGRGEGRVSQPSLAACVEEALPGVEVLREARPSWIGRQRLDVYVPALDLAFEYQGEQHFLPFGHLGGEAGLTHRRELDERKRDACLRAGVRLIEWRYDEPISADRVRARLGIERGEAAETANDPEGG